MIERMKGLPSKNRNEAVFWHIIFFTATAYLLGLLFISIWSGGWTALRVFGTTIVIGASAAVVGGLLGFLFGMPRSFYYESVGSSNTSAAVPEASDASKTSPKTSNISPGSAGASDIATDTDRLTGWANNNLVEVSDWLTKIVVGVGLVQLEEIIRWVGTTGENIGNAAGVGPELAKSFGAAVILLNLGLGFLVTYIYARTLLTVMFAGVSRQIDEELEHQIGEIREAQKTQGRDIQAVVLEIGAQAGGLASVIAQLHRPQPEGFQEAIKLAEDLISKPEYSHNANLWGYLARALGQKYGYDKKQDRPVDELKATADRAYTVVKTTVELNYGKKAWLRSLWDPSDPQHIMGESDLEPLWSDLSQRERFAELLRE